MKVVELVIAIALIAPASLPKRERQTATWFLSSTTRSGGSLR